MEQLSKEFKPEDFSPILLGRVGDYRRDQGDREGARTLYEKLKEDFRKSEYLDYAYTGLGDLAFAEKQYDKALDDLGKAIAQKPTIERYFARAGVYEAKGDVDKATGDYRSATQMAPANAGRADLSERSELLAPEPRAVRRNA